MNCGDVKKILAAYVEEIVSSEEKDLVENHLSSCQTCRNDFEELKRTVALVRDFEPVECPPWFTQKIMSRVRSEQESRKSILQRLFYPLHIKVPLEAFATVLIAVAAVYLFKANELEMKRVHLPTATEQIVSKDESSKQPAEPKRDTTIATGEPVLEGVPKSQKQKGGMQEKNQQTSVPTGTETPSPSILAMKKEVFEKPLGASEPSSQQAQPYEQPSAPAKPDQEIDSTARVPGRSEKADQRTLSARFHVGAMSEKSPVALMVSLRVRDAKAVKPDVENLLGQLGAQNMKKESLQNIEILTAELQAGKTRELVEKLMLLGEVKERGSSSELPQGTLGIRIEIMSSP